MASTTQARNQRRILRWAQSSLCAGCGMPLPSPRHLVRYHPDYPTFDHVTLRSAGGRRLLSNGLLKHLRCNQARGARPSTGCDAIWMTVVAARLADRPRSLKPIFKGGARNPAFSPRKEKAAPVSRSGPIVSSKVERQMSSPSVPLTEPFTS
ncbi:hypothetical protein [Sphingomonas echinoides]|jgi:hypothetical protein|uniref:HNH endonuclease n=2 Tax=Pseudomonadati TaxID=3379134 RepID=A0ABU4PTA2_9SPHN|nr:hypothetical protein [Sphingomonas echinoides]MDX5986427.1 hypothetical protein [Sphingomonas echinoides]